MHNLLYLLPPLFGALTGWAVVHLLMKLLFRPGQPVRIAGFTLQGFIPKNREAFIGSLGSQWARELTASAAFRRQVADPALVAALMPEIEEHINTFLNVRLKEKIPVVTVFMGESTLLKIKTALIEEIGLMLPGVISRYSDTLGSCLDLSAIIREKADAYSPEQLEAAFNARFRRETGQARLLGAVLGCLLGILQALIMTLTL
jgi:uncharacterized membrane protein YheB (UPF0754 family)